MIIPVRCFTCGKVVGNKWDSYLELLKADYSEGDALDELGLRRPHGPGAVARLLAALVLLRQVHGEVGKAAKRDAVSLACGCQYKLDKDLTVKGKARDSPRVAESRPCFRDRSRDGSATGVAAMGVGAMGVVSLAGQAGACAFAGMLWSARSGRGRGRECPAGRSQQPQQ